MRSYLNGFFRELEFTDKERLSLSLAYEKIIEQKETRMILSDIISAYKKSTKSLNEDCFENIRKMANASEIHTYTAFLLTLICLTEELRERLTKLGLSKKNVLLTLSDLKYKMQECERVYGIVGTDKWSWYAKVFLPNVFALGRLQFEIAPYTDKKYEKDGFTINEGDTVLKVHIPASGDPLEERLCSASYREASKFFSSLFPSGVTPFYCQSWLLSPKNAAMLDKKSNIVKFGAKFDLVNEIEFQSNEGLYSWIFNSPPGTPIEKLPRDSSLRRAYAELFERGERATSGHGVIIWKDTK